MNSVYGDLGRPYVNVDKENEHIDSYYSRSLGSEPPHPELDQRMLSDIQSFVDGALEGPVSSRLAIHQSCGRYESLIDWNRDVADVLSRDRERFTFTETWTGHDWGAWRDQIAPGLTLVLGAVDS